MPPGEPAAVVAQGTLPGQRAVRAPLVRAGGAGGRGGDWRRRPITVVGPVAGLRPGVARAAAAARAHESRSREPGPRPAGWPRGCAALGAEVVETPAIRIVPNPPLPSSSEIEELLARLPDQPERSPPAARRPGSARKGCPLPGRRRSGRDRPRHRARAERARARRRRGAAASIAESLVEALEAVEVEGKRVMVARAAEARDVLPDALRERGAEVDVVAALRDRGRAARRRRPRKAGRGRPT